MPVLAVQIELAGLRTQAEGREAEADYKRLQSEVIRAKRLHRCSEKRGSKNAVQEAAKLEEAG